MITSTDGLWVAITKCIPAALAICARRHIASSTSLAATIIKSANSSIIITICGKRGSPAFSAASLYPFMSLTFLLANKLYLFTISCTAHASAPAAFLGSVTTGINKCGIPLYTDNSTTFGSTISNFTSLGFALYKMLVISVFIQTDFPEPVLPAISKWGIFAISVTTASPPTSFPNANVNFDFPSVNLSESIISLKATIDFDLLGTSIPTVCFPGIGASILIVSASRLSAISSDKLAILLTLTPSAGANSYLVIAGPTDTFSTLADTPKLYNVLLNFSAVANNAFLLPTSSFPFPWASNSTGGNS